MSDEEEIKTFRVLRTSDATTQEVRAASRVGVLWMKDLSIFRSMYSCSSPCFVCF